MIRSYDGIVTHFFRVTLPLAITSVKKYYFIVDINDTLS